MLPGECAGWKGPWPAREYALAAGPHRCHRRRCCCGHPAWAVVGETAGWIRRSCPQRLRPPLSWPPELLWNGYGMLMEWFWNAYGIVMEWLWNGYEIVMKWLWNFYRIVMEWLWNIIAWFWNGYGMVMEWLWNFYGIFMGWFWNAYGMEM